MKFSQDEIIKLIHSCKFFSKIPLEKLNAVVSQFELIELGIGDILFSQGDISDHVYVLLKGELVSFLEKSSGKQVILGRVHPIETVGELGAISGEPRSLTVESVNPSYLLRLSGEKFRALCLEYPIIQAELAQLLVHRSVKSIKTMAHEKAILNRLNIIISFIDYDDHNKIKNNLFKNLLAKHFRVLETDNIKESETINLIESCTGKSSLQYSIYMNKLNLPILAACIKMNAVVRLLFKSDEDIESNQKLKEFLSHVETTIISRTELVLFHADDVTQPSNTYKWLQLYKFDLHHHVRISNQEDYARLVRYITGTALVVVLGGGGAKGLVHLGAIKAILDKGFPIDGIGGTSIGANIAASYAFTLDYEAFSKYVHQLKQATIKSLATWNMTWPVISLYSSNPSTENLMSIYKDARIEDLWIPFFCVSSNLSRINQVVHRTGLVWEAIRTSAALPGVYPPMVVKGELLVDGGLINNLPVDVMRDVAGQNQKVVAVSLATLENEKVSFEFPPVITLFQSIMMKLGIGYHQYTYPPFMEMLWKSLQLGSSNKERHNTLNADILVKPNLVAYRVLSVKLKQEKELYDIGYATTVAALQAFLENNPDYLK